MFEPLTVLRLYNNNIILLLKIDEHDLVRPKNTDSSSLSPKAANVCPPNQASVLRNVFHEQTMFPWVYLPIIPARFKYANMNISTFSRSNGNYLRINY